MIAAHGEEKTLVIIREPVPAQPALPPFSFSGARDNTITFKHPGYPDQFGQNILLTLFAFDHPSGGLHYGTAHLACAIVACNAWNGYFTRTRDGPRLELDYDDLLLDRVFYFHVPTGTGKYPVYPNFDNWAFPHDDLPPHWPSAVRSEGEGVDELGAPPSSSTLTAAVLRRDKACVISKQGDCVEKGHLCPRSEVKWFDLNGMSQYNLNRQLIQDAVVDDISNVIALRSDIHTTFDDRKFVIAPKKGQWVVHFTDLTSDLGRLYHNTPLGLHQDVSSKCLLVRFAWAIFPSVMKFLATGAGRMVRMRITVEDEFREVTRKMGTDEARSTFATTRGRSVSPKKRKGDAATDEPGDADSPLQDGPKRRRTAPATPPSNVSCSTAASHPPSKSQPLPHTPPETLDKPLRTHLTDNDNLCGNHHGTMQDRAQDLQQLKRSWILQQRPSDPSLYCCDYNAAEAAAKAGIPGKREWGGSYLCEECLGVEYRDEDEDCLSAG
ncbi:hypothetical protein H2199_009218 [Coniosporium tulheliwenetii]|uniref:Uncharacterized protein n=1 Tax=Coniosporium tulheliwenetii TaxID=3383036 RepID=A0ACC2YF32_9PEZI|nr:hypothetical protein H2199_009218 [Cladosporium sp. JES 115]